MELENIDSEVIQIIRKVVNKTKPNILGELLIDLKSRFMSGDLQHFNNLQKLFDSQIMEKEEEFKERAKMVEKALNSCEGVKTNTIDGAMYAFPRLFLPDKFVLEARAKGMQPDFHYCKTLLEQTGLCTVPGSGFGQMEGTFHLRTTILPSPNERLSQIMRQFKEFNHSLHEKYC